MHFLLFIPGSHGADIPASVGLDALREGASFTPIDAGPGGQAGNLVTWSTPFRHCPAVYDPARQDWEPAVPLNGREAGRYWVGFWRDRPPRPDDLLRADAQRGAAIQFGDGELWEVPRAWELPFDVIRGQGGLYELCVQRRFTEFFVGVHAWKVRFDNAKEGAGFLTADLAEFVEMALGINYRLTPEVISHLRLFQSGAQGSLLKAGLSIVSLARLED